MVRVDGGQGWVGLEHGGVHGGPRWRPVVLPHMRVGAGHRVVGPVAARRGWSCHPLRGAAAAPPVVPFFEEDLVLRVQHPVVTLAVLSALGQQFHEALVQREVVFFFFYFA